MSYWDLYCGDCVEEMRKMEDKSFDAVITDPPWANGTEYKEYTDSRENLIELIAGFMPEALRVAGRVIITPGVGNMWLYPEPTWVMCWANQAGVGSSKWGFTCWQPILCYGKDPFLQRQMGRRPDLYMQHQVIKKVVGHPCPKPTDAMEWLVERTTMPGDRVLDCFCGSGSIGVAAIRRGRHFIGIEKSADYVELARGRMVEAQQQEALL